MVGASMEISINNGGSDLHRLIQPEGSQNEIKTSKKLGGGESLYGYELVFALRVFKWFVNLNRKCKASHLNPD